MWTDGEQGVRSRMKKRRRPHPLVSPRLILSSHHGPLVAHAASRIPTSPRSLDRLPRFCKAPRGRPLSWSAPVLLHRVWLTSRLLSHHHPCTFVLSHTRHRAGGCRACFSFSLYIISRTVYSCILFHHTYTRCSPPPTSRSRPTQCNVPYHAPTFTPRPPSAPHEPTTSPSTTLTPTLGLPAPLLLCLQDGRDDVAKTTRPGSSYLFCSCSTPCDYACVLSICSETAASARTLFVFRVSCPCLPVQYMSAALVLCVGSSPVVGSPPRPL